MEKNYFEMTDEELDELINNLTMEYATTCESYQKRHAISAEKAFEESLKAIYPNTINKENCHLFENCLSHDFTFFVPHNVTRIEKNCFSDEKSDFSCVFNLNFSKNLKFIGSNAFSAMERLDKCNIEKLEHLESIGDYAFSGTGITEITFPNGNYSIGKGIFKNCTRLLYFESHCGLEEIPESMFENCEKLLCVKANHSILCKKIGDYAFKGCKWIDNIDVLFSHEIEFSKKSFEGYNKNCHLHFKTNDINL